MDAIKALQCGRGPVFRVRVLEQPTALRIVAGDLQSKLTAFTNNHVRWPDLDIYRIDLPDLWHLHIC